MQSNGEQNPDDLEGVQKKINQTTNESLESTRRMLGLVAESQDVGTNTMIMLDDQGEQLNRVEDGVNNIHARMNEAERNLTNLQKCCGLCVLPWNRVNRKHRPMSTSTSSSTQKSSPTVAEPKLRMSGDEGGMPSNGYVNRITNDDRETEMDDNLQLVHSYLGNLKNIALDMNDTIGNQNQQIERITKKTDAGNVRVTAANKQAQDILRKA